MFDKLKGLFARAPKTESFADSSFYFLCVPARFAEGIPLSATPDQILALTKDAAADLATATAFEPWTYEDAGLSVLPIFTSQDHAMLFIQARVAEVKRLIPFQALEVPGRVLTPYLRRFDEVRLNPGSPEQATLLKRP